MAKAEEVQQKTHASISYSKWDQFVDSDDEDEKKDPGAPTAALLEINKTGAIRDRDLATRHKFEGHLATFDSGLAKERHPLLAQFVAVCDKGAESNNIYRYQDIIHLCTRHGGELLSFENCDGLCKLHKEMVNSVEGMPEKHPVIRDSKLLMDAINTLEACRRVPNVTEFFEAICQPSHSERNKELTTLYLQVEFGKRAMMRYIFQSAAVSKDGEENPAFAAAVAEEEMKFDDKVLGKAPKGSSARYDGPMPTEELMNMMGSESYMLVGALIFLLIAIGVGGYFWYTLREHL